MPRKATKHTIATIKAKPETHFTKLMPPEALKLLSGGGKEFVERVGMDVVRDAVLNILIGRNLRDSTEVLTRRRLAALNLATVELFMRGAASSDDFIQNLPQLAVEALSEKAIPREERWLAQWVLGLTSKSVQNVLRDNLEKVLSDYRDMYIEACQQIITMQTEGRGQLSGTLRLDNIRQNKEGEEHNSQLPIEAKVDWLMMLYLLSMIGAQTLSIRGSEKSAYGKLFEKLILGSILSILGFKYVTSERPGEGIFWLSSRGEDRESDATLVYKLGIAARFDIGFIGRGNPEIMLDKVSRYRREEEIAGTSSYVATIIVVDKIGRASRIEKGAEKIAGRIVQMSASYWPQEIAKELYKTLQFDHPLRTMDQSDIEAYLKEKLKEIPLEEFVKIIKDADLDDLDGTEGTEPAEQVSLPLEDDEE